MATPGSITFTAVSAFNLAQADRRSDSDPYVRWSLTATGERLAETHFLRNVLGRRGGRLRGSEREPRWDGEYDADLPAGVGAFIQVTVSLWDWDGRGRDDPLGDATFELPTHAKDETTMELYLRNVPDGRSTSVTFTVAIEPPLRAVDPEPSPEPPAPEGPVVRKEIRAMSSEEQLRYAAAVKRMMENAAGPETSEFFRLAGYHGWPGNGSDRNYSYCEHRQETFPGWHRAYLCAFEQALQEADRALGNDGRIGLPYWDVLGRPEVNGEVFPSILREHFPNGVETIRALLKDPAEAGDAGAPAQRRRLWERGYTMAEDDALRRNAVNERLGQRAQDVLWVQEHYRAASTYGSSNQDSIETPHDLVHVLCGYPMRSLMHAAFHPVFWLHHCNIDRLYEAYLQYHPDSLREFESNQEQSRVVNRRRGGNRDRFDQWLEPFFLPGAPDRRFYPRHTFDIRALGYAYDELQTQPAQAITAKPIYAVFEGVDINTLPCSYVLYAFVGSADLQPPLGPDMEALLDHPNYAGLGGIFAGKADVCTNCQNSDPFDVRIDVTAKPREFGLQPSDATLKVVALDEEDCWLPVEQTSIPPPVLRGGGPPFAPSCAYDAGDKANYPPGTTVTYAVEEAPGYLPRGKLLNEVAQCFVQWSGPTASGLEFKRLPAQRAEEAQLVIGWGDHSATNALKFDGPGGKLAEADASRIILDSSERWLLHGLGWEKSIVGARTELPAGAPAAFFLAPVILHELGHALGLTHSRDPNEVMAPHYVADRVELTPRDKERARMAYGVAEPAAEPAAADPAAQPPAEPAAQPAAQPAQQRSSICALL